MNLIQVMLAEGIEMYEEAILEDWLNGIWGGGNGS